MRNMYMHVHDLCILKSTQGVFYSTVTTGLLILSLKSLLIAFFGTNTSLCIRVVMTSHLDGYERNNSYSTLQNNNKFNSHNFRI